MAVVEDLWFNTPDAFSLCRGGGILLKSKDSDKRWPVNHDEELVEKLTKAIEFMRDNPNERLAMGINARTEVRFNWTWDKPKLDAWREFFREGIKKAHES